MLLLYILAITSCYVLLHVSSVLLGSYSRQITADCTALFDMLSAGCCWLGMGCIWCCYTAKQTGRQQGAGAANSRQAAAAATRLAAAAAVSCQLAAAWSAVLCTCSHGVSGAEKLQQSIASYCQSSLHLEMAVASSIATPCHPEQSRISTRLIICAARNLQRFPTSTNHTC
jgi:hypothetical protein